VKPVTAIEHKGRLYRNEEELADEVMRQKFSDLLNNDLSFKYRNDAMMAYSVWDFFRRNEDAILELLKARYSGALIEEERHK
jgi:hypothetical protein